MGWSSFFRRSARTVDAPGTAQEASDPVQRARTRARQRLVGAVVLLAIGVLGFPLVFETQPRPVPVDIPIEIPKKEGAPPLAMPPARAAGPDSAQVGPAPARDLPVPDEVITESRDDAGRDMPPAAVAKIDGAPKPAPATAASAPSRPPEKREARLASAKPEPRSAAATDAARARALLDGQPVASASASASVSASTPAPAAAGRYIVQVGAFAEANAAQETRVKLERLGLKTYTQVANTPAGSRIRVRLGPFGSRDEADRALAKAKSAGLAAVLQTL